MAALRRNCELVHHVFLWSMVSLWALASVAFRVAVVMSVVEGFLDLSNGTLKSPWHVHIVLRGVSCVLRLANSGHHAQLPEKWTPRPVTRLLSSTNEQLTEQHDEKMQHERNQL
jgi:hypothetical protein